LKGLEGFYKRLVLGLVRCLDQKFFGSRDVAVVVGP
jgi:hypothetical protein